MPDRSDGSSNVIPFDVFAEKRRAAASPLRLPIPLERGEVTPTFAILYLADLSGRASRSPEEDWAPRAVERSSLDALVREVAPRVALEGGELAFHALADFDPDAIAARLQDPAALGRALSGHPLRSLEGAWHGLRRILDAIPEGVDVRVDAMGIPRAELLEDLDESPGPRQTQLHALLYEHAFLPWTNGDGRIHFASGRPYALVVLGHELTASPLDAGMLRAMARICASSHAALIADGRGFTADEWGSLDALAATDAARTLALVDEGVALREAHPVEKRAPETSGVAALAASLVARYAERGAAAVASCEPNRLSRADAALATTLSGEPLTKRMLAQHLARRLCLLELDARSPGDLRVSMQKTVAAADDWLLSLADGRRGRMLERPVVVIEEGPKSWSRPTFRLRARALPPLSDEPVDLELEGLLPREA